MSELTRNWTNESVRRLAGDRDPVEVITTRAREVVCRVMDAGWSGPPFDPLVIADHLHLDVVPMNAVRDARTVPVEQKGFRIEFNPTLTRRRVRFSLAHEIAHTLFPDAAAAVRHRARRDQLSGDDWQLEALCNIAAAEFLMPLGSLPALGPRDIAVDPLLEQVERFDVSVEAFFIRAARVTDEACAAFAASRLERGPRRGQFRIDYLIPSSSWSGDIPRGTILPLPSSVAGCSAIGYTAKADETWGELDLHIECVGIPPYPGSSHPRVIGVLTEPSRSNRHAPEIVYLHGDATEPSSKGATVIVHVVNDRARNWGGTGFAQGLRSRWPAVHDDFRRWVSDDKTALSLGKVRFFRVDEAVHVASMVCQAGYGPSESPRIRYAALQRALATVAAFATTHEASVQMPRIGCGQAGGRWEVVRELILATLSAKGIPVTVYSPPGERPLLPVQQTFAFTRDSVST